MMPPKIFILFSIMFIGGCSKSKTHSSTLQQHETTTKPATYSVHEWGVLAYNARTVVAVDPVAPDKPHRPDGMVIKKPILYFHGTGKPKKSMASPRR